ncbi:uncharacterized protein ASCRUDRAFT_8685 [Ascoidea rubescens DSM 1968]|uniref:Uncharacterized protein n=1 Tax=Ascoidea rubescens DSM 1968 TaxID=1344418 RepID=A0A1D2VFR2_9ASCO|nr:hypothetical protein ASCRUDRAFT_8685 [Ascoidea rubescens DSM 1968]ODV60465.1 hypothetical protein ASCRUDRAFT_8685 [Ascoidea rubescens DSM 1968]
MQFSKALLASTIASLASAAYLNSTLTVTNTEIGTTVITVTSCESVTVCTEKPVTTGVTVVTSTVRGTETVYTTYCPLPEETVTTFPSRPTPSRNTTVPDIDENINAGSKLGLGLSGVVALAGLLFL